MMPLAGLSRFISYRKLKKLYTQSPSWLQRAYAAIPYSLRAGRVYRETRALIAETDFLTASRLEELQQEQLWKLLRFAQEHVPYYRDQLRRIGLLTQSDSLRTRFSDLPLLTKQALQESPERFQASGGIGEATYQDNTGGSSGTPFSFLKSNRMYPIEQAYMLAQWERVGYHPSARKLTLRGRTFSGRDKSSRWSYNPIYSELAISTYHLDPETIAESAKQVRAFSPQFIHGYPSAIVRYLKGLLDAGLRPPEDIRAVLCGSEPVYAYQRDFITSTLGCRTYSWYGQSECVLLAGECEDSEDYHAFPLYGLLELIDDDGQPIVEPGIEGEIVGTSLNNLAMPFIRYRTGDRGILAPVGPCRCGREHPRLTRVTGRIQHFIYTRRETAVPVTAFVFGQHFQAFQRICAMQLQQDEPGRLLIRIVRGRGYSETDERELRDKMQRSVDDDLYVDFEYCDRLPTNAAGKTEFVIQRVSESVGCETTTS